MVITASPDSTIRIWNVPTSQTTLLLRSHDSAVTGLSLHPTGDYIVSTSEDQHWAFSDIRAGRLLTKVADQSNVTLTTAQFHPDGLIFGVGTADSQVKIWDLKELKNVANFTGNYSKSHFLKFDVYIFLRIVPLLSNFVYFQDILVLLHQFHSLKMVII